MNNFVANLPHLNAALNAASGVLLMAGYINIRRGNIATHRKFMLSAVTTSGIFLISYLVYHFYHGATTFRGTGLARPLYFSILLTHTFFAAIVAPTVIIVLRYALRGDFNRHRKLARYLFPVWMYVSVTGVIVYLLLYHIYPSR